MKNRPRPKTGLPSSCIGQNARQQAAQAFDFLVAQALEDLIVHTLTVPLGFYHQCFAGGSQRQILYAPVIRIHRAFNQSFFFQTLNNTDDCRV